MKCCATTPLEAQRVFGYDTEQPFLMERFEVN